MSKQKSNVGTVFLTEEESSRIRSTVNERLKRCSELSDQSREPRERKGAVSQAVGASLMADMGGAQEDSLPALGVGILYPPSIVAIRNLEPMKLSELRMNQHHRGRQLTIKRVSPVVTLTARSWTMATDEDGEDTERVEMCLHKLRYGEDYLESARDFVIKEPFFTITEEGEPTLLIDHPSDLIICGEEGTKFELHPKGESVGSETVKEGEKAAIRLKNQGNKALKEPDLPQALEKYTAALKIASQDTACKESGLVQDVSRNIAFVNLALDCLDDAKKNAKAAIIGKDDQRSRELDAKAYSRAGSAAYLQGRYTEAQAYYEEQQKLTPQDKETNINLRRVELRLREQEHGSYNFKKIQAGLSRNRPKADSATYIKKTTVKDSPGKGRGLFASCDFAEGDLIMCEKAFCIVWGHQREALTAMTYDVRDDKIRASAVGLTRSIVQKLMNNPSEIEAVMQLYSDYAGDGKNVFRTEDGPVVDVFRVHDIVSRNAFGASDQFNEEGSGGASTGLWLHAAYANHSCIPNAVKESIGDLMLLRATRLIKAGEEICHSYDASWDYDARQAMLKSTWGFTCNCALCSVEGREDAALRSKRMELAGEAAAFVEKNHWADAKRVTKARAKTLAKAIDDTYVDEGYQGLPRPAAENIQRWIALSSHRGG